MSEQWYYSHEGQELGPVSAAQLKQLAEDGSLKATDLVWREGMDDWAPAGQVKGLVAAFVPDAPPSRGGAKAAPVIDTKGESGVAKNYRQRKGPGLSELVQNGRNIAQWLLIVGIVLVLTARGCDRLGTRSVARLHAKNKSAENQFKDKWQAKQQVFDDEIERYQELRKDEIKKKQEASEPYSAEQLQRHNDTLDEYDDSISKQREKITELQEEKAETERTLAKGEWRQLKIASRDASANNAMNAYWYELLFVFGSQLLVVGLLIMGLGGQGPERWICLIMLAIITFSLYVGGIAWINSVNFPSVR
jgi:hypothetical protein